MAWWKSILQNLNDIVGGEICCQNSIYCMYGEQYELLTDFRTHLSSSTANWDYKRRILTVEDLSHLFGLACTLAKQHVNNRLPLADRWTDWQASQSGFRFLCQNGIFSDQHDVKSPGLNQVQSSVSATVQQQTAFPTLVSGSVPACCIAGMMMFSQTQVKTVLLNRFCWISTSPCTKKKKKSQWISVKHRYIFMFKI